MLNVFWKYSWLQSLCRVNFVNGWQSETLLSSSWLKMILGLQYTLLTSENLVVRLATTAGGKFKTLPMRIASSGPSTRGSIKQSCNFTWICSKRKNSNKFLVIDIFSSWSPNAKKWLKPTISMFLPENNTCNNLIDLLLNYPWSNLSGHWLFVHSLQEEKLHELFYSRDLFNNRFSLWTSRLLSFKDHEGNLLSINIHTVLLVSFRFVTGWIRKHCRRSILGLSSRESSRHDCRRSLRTSPSQEKLD